MNASDAKKPSGGASQPPVVPEKRPVALCKYFRLAHEADGEAYIETRVRGIPLLRFVLLNKGTGFPLSERRALQIDGLVPTRVSSMDEQLHRAYKQYREQPTALGRYVFLRGLQERQEILFHALVQAHLEEMMPIVYTPTVGDAVEKFSALYQSPRGLTVNDDNVDRLDEILDGYPLHDVRVMVVTDSSAILGIGDQGYGGVGISIGKLTLYTAGAGLCPFYTMPVGLDVGTDQTCHRRDPLYLGAMRDRMKGEPYEAFIDKFVKAVHKRWPEAIIQWEDLAKDAAFSVLERYRHEVPSLNDDIQGTGAVTLAGVLSACRIKEEKLADQRFLVYGAGAGGIGVATAIHEGLVREGLTEQEAHDRLFVLDSGGLLMTNRQLPSYKQPFAHDPSVVKGWTYKGKAPRLEEVAKQAGITVLLGLSGQPESFTKKVVQAVAANTDRPVIFPLSNPTKLAEATPEQVLTWTKGRALVATGSPFEPVEHGGCVHMIGQGNNAFVFPGLGLGAMLARVREVTDEMVVASAYAVATYTAENHPQLLFPPLNELPAVSRRVTSAVVRQAVKDGVSREEVPTGAAFEAWLDQRIWKPEYLPIKYVEGGPYPSRPQEDPS